MDVIHICAEEFESIEPLYKEFLTKIANDNSPALVNMGYEGPAGLAYLVKQQARWTAGIGQIDFLLDNNEIVGVSAVETSSLSSVFGSGGNRCWLLPKYRSDNSITKYLLTSNLEWSREQGHVGLILTFNNYNKWIYNTIKKRTTGKAGALGSVWSNWWNDCVPFERQLNVFYTPQWAVVKPLASIDVVKDGMRHIDMEFGLND
jgi:hypothetical protein